MTATIKCAVFSDLVPCSLVQRYQRYGGIYCLRLERRPQDRRVFHPEGESGRIIRKAGGYLPTKWYQITAVLIFWNDLTSCAYTVLGRWHGIIWDSQPSKGHSYGSSPWITKGLKPLAECVHAYRTRGCGYMSITSFTYHASRVCGNFFDFSASNVVLSISKGARL